MRAARVPRAIAIGLALASGATMGQVPLHPGELVVVSSEWNRAVQTPVRCDNRGNIYLRTYATGGQRAPVLRVDDKGTVKKLAFDQDADLVKASVFDFGVSADGDVFQLANRGDDSYLVRFSTDGAYKGKTKIESRLWAAHVAPLGPEHFLITGLELPDKPEAAPPTKPLTVVINSSGKVTRTLSLPGDVAVETAPEDTQGDSVAVKPGVGTTSPATAATPRQARGDASAEATANLPLLLGDLEDGGDGYAYLLRRASPALVYVISPSGRVVRTLKLASPSPDLMVSAMHVAAGRVALVFAEPPEKLDGQPERLPRLAILFDTTTGEKIAQYEVPKDAVGAFACYDASDRFAFVRSSQGKLAIRWASTR